MMTIINAFTYSTIEALKYYVYALVDSTTKKICYIGKGTGQRVFESLSYRSKTLNQHLNAYIIRHGLSEKEAFLVEATLIDFLPYFSISNLPGNTQGGVGNNEVGIQTAVDVEIKYSAPIIDPTEFQHNVLIVTIDRSVGPDYNSASAEKIYECTRKSWLVGWNHVKKVDFVIAKYQGLLKEIYRPDEWYKDPVEPDQRRYAFKGQVVGDDKIRELYLNKQLNKKRVGSPTLYIH